MSLRALAESDLSFIVEDAVTGFGWPITLIAPDSQTESLTGFSNDISQVIDPDTGVAVSGRLASIALRLSSISIGTPKGITDKTSRPWYVIFNDINLNQHTFKILKTNPDRGLGTLTCLLELYRDGDTLIQLNDIPILNNIPNLEVVPQLP